MLNKCEYFSSLLFSTFPLSFVLTPEAHLFENTNTVIPTCLVLQIVPTSLLYPPPRPVTLQVSLVMKTGSAHALRVKARVNVPPKGI